MTRGDRAPEGAGRGHGSWCGCGRGGGEDCGGGGALLHRGTAGQERGLGCKMLWICSKGESPLISRRRYFSFCTSDVLEIFYVAICAQLNIGFLLQIYKTKGYQMKSCFLNFAQSLTQLLPDDCVIKLVYHL